MLKIKQIKKYVYCGECGEIYPIIDHVPMCNGRKLDKCYYCKGNLCQWHGHGTFEKGWDGRTNEQNSK